MVMQLSDKITQRTASVLRPDWLVPTLSTTQVGAVAEWRYTASDIQAQSMSISPANLMMFKAFNPLCRYRGLSPLNPAAFAIDQLNEYNRTNYSLLKTVCSQRRLTNNRIRK